VWQTMFPHSIVDLAIGATTGGIEGSGYFVDSYITFDVTPVVNVPLVHPASTPGVTMDIVSRMPSSSPILWVDVTSRATDRVNLDLVDVGGRVRFSVYDQLVGPGSAERVELRVPELGPGVYFLRATTLRSGSSVAKWILAP